MPRTVRSDLSKRRAKRLIESLLDAAERFSCGTLDDPKFKWTKNNLTVTASNSRLVPLVKRHSDEFSGNNKSIAERIRETKETLKNLGVLSSDNQSGCGNPKFTLKLWSRDIKENLDHFDKCWEQHKAINSGSRKTAPAKAPNVCPYKGLNAFTKEDYKYFFGRDKFTQTLAEAVNQQPFVAVVGNSGSGKSSVVAAGLIPKLEAQGGWSVFSFRPYNDPFFPLANALLDFLQPESDALERLSKARQYAKQFEDSSLVLKDILVLGLQEKLGNQRLLIVVDQFEELYTLCSEAQRQSFIDQFLEVVNAEAKKRDPKVVLVITLRADFYGQVINYQPLLEAWQQWKPENIGLMSLEELREAIEKPAQSVGLTIQAGLTNIILDAVKNNPGELPLLEFALEQLWKKQIQKELTISAYEEVGGVEKALVNHAEKIYEKLKEDEKKNVQQIFTQLVCFGENTEDTRRLATREQIGEDNWKLVIELAGERLVSTGYDESQEQSTVEVIHEALIRKWERLRGWMEEDREFRKWQERLRFQMESWKKTGRTYDGLLRGAFLVEAEDWLHKQSLKGDKGTENFMWQGFGIMGSPKKKGRYLPRTKI